MPHNKTSHTLAVSEASAAVGVGIHSLRRWAEWHSDYLSPGANPAPGQAKRYTGRDIEVLRHVKALRDEGLQTRAINEQLATLTFAEIDTSEQDESAVALAPTSPDAHTAPPALIVVVDDHETRLAAVERSMQAARQNQRDPVYYMAVGAIGALVFVMFLLLLFLVRHYL